MAAGLRGLYTIPAGRPFAEDLAAGILAEVGLTGDPFALADTTILVPTRRAARTLREAFLRAADGRPLLLPAMRAIADAVDDDTALAPAIEAGGSMGDPALAAAALAARQPVDPVERTVVLAHMLLAWSRARGTAPFALSEAGALGLARELGAFLDELTTERVTPDRLEGLVTGDLALRYEETLALLRVVTRQWTAWLADTGQTDRAAHRDAMLLMLAERWQTVPPQGLTVVAGSTGSVPATAGVIAAVAGLPRGVIVLPGLDTGGADGLDADAWDAIGADHPQFGMKQLIDQLGVAREAVAPWPATPRPSPAEGARRRLLNEALRPAETTDAWSGRDRLSPETVTAAMAGLTVMTTPDERAEAGAIALMLREVLETPGRTAILVTPDRALARQVAVAMRRWAVAVDDSAGIPLTLAPAGRFLLLLGQAAAAGLSPVALLDLLNHPLAAAGMAREDFAAQVRLLERLALRGPKPLPGRAGLVAAIHARAADRHTDRLDKAGAADAVALVERVAACLAPLTALADGPHPLPALVTALAMAAEALAATDETGGAARLWDGDGGEAARDIIQRITGQTVDPVRIALASVPLALRELMADATVRPRQDAHPRLRILGAPEARMQAADLVILGALDEGVWPRIPDPGPWLSRGMRNALGLVPPERRIGLAAHDVATLAAAPRVVLTRALRRGGTPMVASRWLLRLESLVRGALGDDGVATLHGQTAPGSAPAWPLATLNGAGWAGLLDFTADPAARAAGAERPPAPRPPVEARPRKLPVTGVETLLRDPYAVYAKRILRLEPLDPLEAAPGAADKGTLFHDILDRFIRETMTVLPPGEAARDRLLAIGAEAFRAMDAWPAARTIWWLRFVRIADWFIAQEAEWREKGNLPIMTEVQHEIVFDAPAGPFTLTAKADRIDRGMDGVTVIDYKTGAPPSTKQIISGFAPQLPLEGAMVLQGAFGADLRGVPLADLAFIKLSGGQVPGEFKSVKGMKLKDPRTDDPLTLEALCANALVALKALVARYDDPRTPYPPRTAPQWVTIYDDYAHLARTTAWEGEEA